jgi:hypothetical protein
MTDAICQPASALAFLGTRGRPDRFVKRLQCLPDLVEIAQLPGEPDPRAREAVDPLTEVERSLREVSVEAASIRTRASDLIGDIG